MLVDIGIDPSHDVFRWYVAQFDKANATFCKREEDT